MFSESPRLIFRLLTGLAFLLTFNFRALADPTGPTLQFGYGEGQPLPMPMSQFMYFVPLISPEQVSSLTNAGNTQCARVLACQCHTNGTSIHAVCDFDFVGEGLQRNEFGHAAIIHRRHQELEAGKALPHQLAALSVEGNGTGTIEVEGSLVNGEATVSQVKIRFNTHGHSSPVTVDLEDITLRDGTPHYDNAIVARVNTLTFLPKSDPPHMEVSLASVKKKDAGNSHWSNFMGEIKGGAANMMLPPLIVTTDGHQTMLDFGKALALHQATFTFPFAPRLTNGPAIQM